MNSVKPQSKPKIYIVNCKSDLERKKSVENGFASAQVKDYEIITATEPKHIFLVKEQLYNKKLALDYYGQEIKDTEISCLVSHLRIYKKLIKNNIPYALIMEDDAKFSEEINNVFKRFEEIKDSVELLLLDTLSNDDVLVKTNKNFMSYNLSKCLDRPCGTQCYILTKKGAEKILKYALPCASVADWPVPLNFYIKYYCLYPKVPCLSLELSSVSKIGGRNFVKNKFKRTLIFALNTFNPFLIYEYGSFRRFFLFRLGKFSLMVNLLVIQLYNLFSRKKIKRW